MKFCLNNFGFIILLDAASRYKINSSSKVCLACTYGSQFVVYFHTESIGWTANDCPDENQLKVLGDDMKTAIAAVHGKSYTSQKSIGLYKTTGTASDWSVSIHA